MKCSDCHADVDSMPADVLVLREKAMPLLEAGKWAMRSCGHCNGAHGHLMEDDFLFRCFCCGHLYYGGKRLSTGEGEAEP